MNTKPAAQPQTQPLQGAFGGLLKELQRAIAAEGYVHPTPIQEQCIPLLLDGQDLIGSAPTGTGKTAAFVLPLLQKLAADTRPPRQGTPRALILAPTRELAAQIAQSIQTYGKFLRLRHTVVFGGVNQMSQVKALRRGVDILVATPGRLLDLYRQNHVRFSGIQYFILDEVDRMLDMGFLPDIKQVLEEIPPERQTLFFSATLAPAMLSLAHTMVTNPAVIAVADEGPALDRIRQRVLFVGKKNKTALLLSLFNDPKVNKVIVFTQMKHTANQVTEMLMDAGISGTAIHGNKTQAARNKALHGFKQGHFRALVATDVAARGIDVDDITHVINYDLPVEAETYIHRIGRTARAGATGHAISFCCAESRAYLRDIEKMLGEPVPMETDHPYHCEDAFHSTMSRPILGGRGGRSGGGRQGGGKRFHRGSGPHPARRKPKARTRSF
ncbi:MAG: DEAD/DEAH box helicase [Kiritimatiellae bacterium]|nr:DEAD/DEAH box helicase [Kiritimatiellia bacterium]